MCAIDGSMQDRSRRELICFVVLSLFTTAAFHLSLPLLGLSFSLSLAQPSLYIYLAGMAMPAVVALLLCKRGERKAFIRSSLSPTGSAAVYIAAFLAQVGVVSLAWLLLFGSGGSVESELSPGPGFLLLAAGQLWIILGEEPGWRGFALPRLIALSSPRWATLALALVWGIWHTPMFFVPGSFQASASPFLFAASIFAWSAIHTALYQASRPTIVPNLLFHGLANITFFAGLVPAELEPYLLVSYLLVGSCVWASLVQDASRRSAAV
jgi:membrane protease YdiL (CAAX protease family)